MNVADTTSLPDNWSCIQLLNTQNAQQKSVRFLLHSCKFCKNSLNIEYELTEHFRASKFFKFVIRRISRLSNWGRFGPGGLYASIQQCTHAVAVSWLGLLLRKPYVYKLRRDKCPPKVPATLVTNSRAHHRAVLTTNLVMSTTPFSLAYVRFTSWTSKGIKRPVDRDEFSVLEYKKLIQLMISFSMS